MKQAARLACAAAAMLLTCGIASAADSSEPEQAKPGMTAQAPNQSTAKEDTTHPQPPQGNAAPAKEEPACD